MVKSPRTLESAIITFHYDVCASRRRGNIDLKGWTRMANDDAVVRRVPARTGRVSYSTPVVIRGTGQTHFEVLPQYISHNTKPDELSLKVAYWKSAKEGIKYGYPVEFTLKHGEVLKLRDVINRALALAEQGENGEYVVLKLGSQEVFTAGQDAAALGRSLASALANPEIFNALKGDEQGRILLGAVHISARLAELSQAIGDLRAALRGGKTSEQWYQAWFERNSWAFGNAYTMRDSVRAISAGDNVDALMVQTANGLRDIFELKRPDMAVLNYDLSHRSYYWTADASKAIGQCHRYIDVLHDEARNGLRDHPEVVAHYPRAFVVQGRSHDWNDDKFRALHGLNGRLHGVQIMTYDQLLAQSERLLSIMTTAAESEGAEALEEAETSPYFPELDDPWGEPPGATEPARNNEEPPF